MYVYVLIELIRHTFFFNTKNLKDFKAKVCACFGQFASCCEELCFRFKKNVEFKKNVPNEKNECYKKTFFFDREFATVARDLVQILRKMLR